jgi:hypothetical protein
MKPLIFVDHDDDFYAAEDMGISRNRLCRDAYCGGDWFPGLGGELHLHGAVVITDGDYPEAVDQAEMCAFFLSGHFATVRVVALPGGLAGWIARGGNAGSL